MVPSTEIMSAVPLCASSGLELAEPAAQSSSSPSTPCTVSHHPISLHMGELACSKWLLGKPKYKALWAVASAIISYLWNSDKGIAPAEDQEAACSEDTTGCDAPWWTDNGDMHLFQSFSLFAFCHFKTCKATCILPALSLLYDLLVI